MGDDPLLDARYTAACGLLDRRLDKDNAGVVPTPAELGLDESEFLGFLNYLKERRESARENVQTHRDRINAINDEYERMGAALLAIAAVSAERGEPVDDNPFIGRELFDTDDPDTLQARDRGALYHNALTTAVADRRIVVRAVGDDDPDSAWIPKAQFGAAIGFVRDPEPDTRIPTGPGLAVDQMPGALDDDRIRDLIARDKLVARHAAPAGIAPEGDRRIEGVRPSHIPWLRELFTDWERANERPGAPPGPMTSAIMSARPVNISAPMVTALQASDPPDDDIIGDLRFPHETTMITLGATIDAARPGDAVNVETRLYRPPEIANDDEGWPDDLLVGAPHDWWITVDNIDSGWALAFPSQIPAIILYADPDGRLRPEAIVLILTLIGDEWWKTRTGPNRNEGPLYLPWAMVTGDWRTTHFADQIRRVAAAVAICEPDGYDTRQLAFPDGKARKFTRTSAFRKAAARGDYVKVRVIDLHPDDHPPEGLGVGPASTVSPHFRKGHFRRVRHGTRDDWYYVPTWIRPTMVRGMGARRDIQVWKAS